MVERCEAVSVHVLADLPHLVATVGRIRWREWGHAPEPAELSWWLDVTGREAGRDELPVTLVAVDSIGEAVGAVGLGEFDIDERRDRSPWMLGMVVRRDRRGAGVGRCGWHETETLRLASGESATVLKKPLQQLGASAELGSERDALT